MDESPSEAMNLMNEEKISKKSSWEALPTQMKVESLDLHANDMNSKKYEKNGVEFHFYSPPPPSERKERLHGDTLLRRAMRVEMEMMRSSQKLEKVCKHRGLPIDKETLCSDASKDAFDLRDLNESLPSTSEKKLSDSVYRRILHLGGSPSLWRRNVERFEGIRYSVSSNLDILLDSAPLPESKRSPAGFNLLKDKDIRNIRNAFPSLRQRARRRKAYEELLKKCEEQKAASEGGQNSVAEKALQNSEGQGVHLNLNVQTMDSVTTSCSTIADVPLGDKPEEKSTRVENNPQNVGFPPLLQPSWDSEKTWITDFQSPQLSVPLNSPTKWEPKFEGTGCNQSMAKLLADAQAHRFKELRVHNKLRLLNTHRGVVSGDMDDTSSEQDTSSEPVTNTYRYSRKRLSECHKSITAKLDLLRTRLDMFQRLKGRQRKAHSESMGSINCINSHFFVGNMNSDKVLPD